MDSDALTHFSSLPFDSPGFPANCGPNVAPLRLRGASVKASRWIGERRSLEARSGSCQSRLGGGAAADQWSGSVQFGGREGAKADYSSPEAPFELSDHSLEQGAHLSRRRLGEDRCGIDLQAELNSSPRTRWQPTRGSPRQGDQLANLGVRADGPASGAASSTCRCHGSSVSGWTRKDPQNSFLSPLLTGCRPGGTIGFSRRHLCCVAPGSWGS